MPKFRPPEKPMGVTILAALYIVGAVMFFAIFGLFIALGILALGALGIICISPFLVLGVIYLLVGIGLNGLQSWAWVVAFVFAILGLLTNIWDLLSTSIPAASSLGSVDTGLPLAFYAIILLPAISIVLHFIIILYLTMVKEYFR